MAYAQGSIVLAPASYKRGLRPYLIASNADRPFFGDEYTVAVITTRSRGAAIELREETLVEGRLKEYPSYVNPWSLHVFQHGDVDRRVAQVGHQTIVEVADEIYGYVRPLERVDG
jgi:hypothetical protein